jgi:hypothetical protein
MITRKWGVEKLEKLEFWVKIGGEKGGRKSGSRRLTVVNTE